MIRGTRILGTMIAVLLLGWPVLSGLASAQQFDLGQPSDPCTGGLTYTIPFGPPGTTDATLRYGTFTCTLPSPAGPFIATIAFVEPTVTAPGQRIFRVLADDILILDQFDLLAACGYRQPCSRSFVVAPSSGSTLRLRFVTQVRSAVVSSVSIAPLLPAVSYGRGLMTVTQSGSTEVLVDSTVVQLKGSP